MSKLDLFKLIRYILKYLWLPVLAAAVGFAAMYYYTETRTTDTYTASGTMYVYNGNPNLVNYQYTTNTDLTSAVQLIDTYLVVVKSKKVMDVVAERLSASYPEITAGGISSTLSMAPVSETGVVSISSTTGDPQKSADIVNAVLDSAPAEIIRVVGAGGVEIIDYAQASRHPNPHDSMKMGVVGAAAGMIVVCGLLFLAFMIDKKVADTEDLTERYTPPVLASLRQKGKRNALLTDKSPMDAVEGYAILRMNLFYALAGKASHTVVITSPMPEDRKSTVAANLALSCSQDGKKVLLVDADLRRACQKEIFLYDDQKGLSEILTGECAWKDAVITGVRDSLDLLSAGSFPANPAELLGSDKMKVLLSELEQNYELVLMDMPPVNMVSDPLVLSDRVAGCLFAIRQDRTKHKDLVKALVSSEMTGMEVLGFIFCGKNLGHSGLLDRKRYKAYYKKYDHRNN